MGGLLKDPPQCESASHIILPLRQTPGTILSESHSNWPSISCAFRFRPDQIQICQMQTSRAFGQEIRDCAFPFGRQRFLERKSKRIQQHAVTNIRLFHKPNGANFRAQAQIVAQMGRLDRCFEGVFLHRGSRSRDR